MFQLLQIATLLLVAIAWALAFAHAAEYPGKMRLDRGAYLAVQAIYYPGFTIGGASEPLATLALAALLALTPWSGAASWLIVGSLAAAILTQAVYWSVTQPVNRIWAKDLDLGGAAASFFATGRQATGTDWKELRDRWEGSHLVRASLMSLALIALAVALTLPPRIS